ncbi:MAG TPA: urease accessory protein UreD [Acetobacteraceae bacterium]|jgi:urease accessory protein|nr:urease accessory protein UreD [Acetobacteraceae bacterium]
MCDAACLSDPQTLQRAVGELVVSVRRRGDNTVLDGLRQVGCLKARFPRALVPGWSDVVTLNTSGGIAAGDRLESTFRVRAGARASIAAQAAERLYRALPGNQPSWVRTRIAVEPGAAAEWLPQETILFDRCMLDRRLDVDLADDAWFLGVESLIFGRAAMGETVAHAWLRDLIQVRRDRRLLWHDAMRLEGDVSAILRRKTVADGACAIATLVHVARGAEAALDAVRAALPGAAGASAWNGMLIARILADSSATLRTSVTTVLRVVRGQRPLPRVWMC